MGGGGEQRRAAAKYRSVLVYRWRGQPEERGRKGAKGERHMDFTFVLAMGRNQNMAHAVW